MTENGVESLVAEAGGFRIAELRFPGGYVQPVIDPDAAYLAFVVEGAVEKQFRGRRLTLRAGTVGSIPEAAAHGARFHPDGTVIVVIRPPAESSDEPALRRLFGSVRGRPARDVQLLARRVAVELRTRDAAAPLILEGLALGAVAALLRESDSPAGAAPGWLADVLGTLDASVEAPTLAGLAELAGVHPSHLARVFRRHCGTSVGAYLRRLRLERAARRLVASDEPLAAVAVGAGFADQSHFTRIFKEQVGVTPGRYRALMRGHAGAGDRMRAARAAGARAG